ncbi:MAG: cobyrinate a,c-diamide synthase, partial [Pseudomonadota bacterium]
GHRVAGGKCGPDYIDPAFHAAACGVPSLTYDAWAMTPAALRHQAYGSEAELLVIEGAMGVLDGAGAASMGSAAQTAEILGLPLVLVIDVAKTGASAVLPVAGLRALHPEVPLAGVILNRVASPRHARILEHAFAGLGVPILGQLPRDPDLTLPERHLGLVQASEHPALEAFLARVGGVLARNADVVAIAAACLPVKAGTKPALLPPLGQRIAVASDTAFAFAYPHILEGWRSQGAEVLPFSPLANAAPDPRADAIFLPGGYPELHAGTLAAAARFRSAMKTTQARIYGECGGYMTLGEGLIDAQGTLHRMLGLLPLETSFERRKRTIRRPPGCCKPGAIACGPSGATARRRPPRRPGR